MDELIEKIQGRLTQDAYPSEAAISVSVVLPILRALGWDETDPEQVMPEYASGQRRVDFALCGAPRRPSIFVEVKGVGRAVEGDRQLFEYAFHEGIPLCLLTDGRDWSFYYPSGQGNYDERRIYRLQLNERPAAECSKYLNRYLSRSRVKSGDALEDAIRDYRDLASRREATRSLPKAWYQLVEEPEDLLVELLSEQAEAICGFQPPSEEVARFLRSLSPSGPSAGSPLQKPPRATPPAPKPPVAEPKGSSAGRAIEYQLFGMRHSAPNATTALIDILTAIAKRHPEKMAEVAAAVRGRSRNHIARTVSEIYPARPDLARAVEFAPGWLVGLNIANREKLRIIQEACRATGMKFGTDIVIDLPNA